MAEAVPAVNHEMAAEESISPRPDQRAPCEKERSVSVVIPFTRPASIGAAIESVRGQCFPMECIEIIAVGVNAGQLRSRWPDVIGVDTPTPVYPGKARNLGAAKASGEILMFLDDDCEAAPGWIEEALVELENPSVGATSGMIAGRSAGLIARSVDFANFGQCQTSLRAEGRLWTASFAIKKSVFDRVGGFDESLQFQEDIDLCFKLNRAGYKTVYQPRIKVRHDHGRATLRELLWYQYRNGRGAGLTVESAYPDVSFRNRLLSQVQNPLLYALLVLPFSLAGTVTTVVSNFRDHREVAIVSPLVFLGKLSCQLGILRTLVDQAVGGSWQAYGRQQTALKILQYSLFKGWFRTPRVLTLFVTSACNARCQHCFYWQNLNQKNDISLEEIKGLSRALGKIDKLLIGGGEPFLRRDLPEICSIFFDNNDAGMVSIPTNGLTPGLIRNQLERILQVAKGRTVRLNISIDGSPGKHDTIRGVPGNFEKATMTYDAARSLQARYPNLSVGINSCVMNANYDDMFTFYDEMPTRFPDVDLPGLILLRGSPYEKSLTLPDETKLAALHRHKRHMVGMGKAMLWKLADYANFHMGLETLRREEQVVPCEAGRILGVVEDNGNVKHCEMLPPIGNLRDKSFMEIWNSPEAKVAREKIVRGECHCTHECNLFESYMAHPVKGTTSLARATLRDRGR
jgi:MoaA/NifB/PqqE/SkfB family radical SAM enzyme/glycosyltransferase involved in cell wall biosynthesis